MARCSKKRWGVWEWSNASGAKAHSFLSIRNAALEGPLFHGIPQAGASWSVPSRPVERVGPYALSLGERDGPYSLNLAERVDLCRAWGNDLINPPGLVEI